MISQDKSGLLGQSGFGHPISVLLSPPLPPWLVGKRKTPPSKVKNLRMRAVCLLFFKALVFKLHDSLILFYLIFVLLSLLCLLAPLPL